MNKLKDFLFLNLNDYENIGINLPIGAILIAVSVCMIALAFYYYFMRNAIKSICTRLLRANAISSDKGRTLGELRLAGSMAVKIALRGGGELASIVKRVGEKKLSYEEYVSESGKKGVKSERINISDAEFYILPDKRDRAEKISAENHSVLTPIIISFVFAAILVLAVFFLSDLLSLIDKNL